MQAKSEKKSEYSRRTEYLSEKIGVNLSDLPDKIGVSHSMFHAYRSGKQPISGKAWQKLEAAEDAAGIFVNERQVLERQSRTQAENTLHDDAENLDSALCRLLMLLDLPTLLKVLKRLDDKDRIPTVPSRLLTSRIIDTLNERQLEASSESTQPETRS